MALRREFLKTVAGLASATLVADRARAAAAADQGKQNGSGSTGRDRLGKLLPTRRLGRTGVDVTMLGVGGWHIGRMTEKEAQKTIEVALAGGVRFFDTAASYQGGTSETYYGKLLVPKYRDVVFLMSKTQARTKAAALKELDETLARLKTDRLDLWQIHDIRDAADVEGRLKEGVLDAFLEARQKGKARFIGFTGHRTYTAHVKMLEMTDELATCQMPINVTDPSYESFITNVMPVLIKRNIAPLAMKTLANGGFFGGSGHGRGGDGPKVVPNVVSMEDAIHFPWAVGASVLITGPDDAAQMKEKVALARSFKEMADRRRAELVAAARDLAGRRVEFYKA
jgi:aryl-alcohol dehydrogenase-like predicted oxidoreductase